MSQNEFKNPETGDTYTWHINHREEEKRLESPFSASTLSGGGVLPQFGGSKAEVWTLRGTILRKSQHDAFEAWLALSTAHTIYYTDCDGVEFEVMILSYAPRKVAGVNNNDPDNMPSYYYTYELTMLNFGATA